MSERLQLTNQTPQKKGALQLVDMYAVPMPDGALQLKSPGQSAEIRGKAVREIVPKLLSLLDGTRSLESLKSELASAYPTNVIEQIVGVLKAKGLVREVEPVPPSLTPEDVAEAETMARYFGLTGSRYATLAALRQAHIGILNAGPVAPMLAQAFAKFGVREITFIAPDLVTPLECQQSRVLKPSDAGRRWADVLAGLAGAIGSKTRLNTLAIRPEEVTDWSTHIVGLNFLISMVQGPVLFSPWLERLNQAAIAANLPWTTVALLDGDRVHIGPTIRPRVTPCYKCFELRFKSHLTNLDKHEAFSAYVQRLDQPLDFGMLPPVADILAGLTAMEVVRAISPDQTPVTSGRLLTFSISELTTEVHPVLKLPRCPHCSWTKDLPPQRIWS
jgi:bacteriocin biosynthesis cyclodehydratase domain-containing protein